MDEKFELKLWKAHINYVTRTRRQRPKSAPYLRLKNIQGTTIGDIRKKYFFKKSIWLKKSRNAEKPKKRSFRPVERFFTNLKLQKMQGGPFDRIRKFSKVA